MDKAALPYWLLVLQALAVPAIALLGAAIALAQWHTARSKLVLDLFHERMDVYEKLGRTYATILVHDHLTEDAITDFNNACKRPTSYLAAMFLTGWMTSRTRLRDCLT